MAGRKSIEWQFAYFDLVRCTGLSENAVRQHVSRGSFDPARIETLVLWLARHASPKLRMKIIESAIYGDLREKRRAGIKKAATKKAAEKKSAAPE